MARPRKFDVPRGVDDIATAPITKSYFHEIAPDLSAELIEDQFEVPPRAHPVRVRIRSEVIATGAKQFRSIPYLASVRRRNADVLSKMVLGLHEYADRPDLAVYTYPLFSKSKQMLELLEAGEKEGNARLIIRMIRDTFMNGQWENYRRSDTRTVVAALIEGKLIAEDVTIADAGAVFDKLADLGFNPVGAELPAMEKDNEQEEAQVPC